MPIYRLPAASGAHTGVASHAASSSASSSSSSSAAAAGAVRPARAHGNTAHQRNRDVNNTRPQLLQLRDSPTGGGVAEQELRRQREREIQQRAEQELLSCTEIPTSPTQPAVLSVVSSSMSSSLPPQVAVSSSSAAAAAATAAAAAVPTGRGDGRAASVTHPSPDATDAERLNRPRTFDGESSLVSELDRQHQREHELRQQRAAATAAVNGHVHHMADTSRGQSNAVDGRRSRVRPLQDPDTEEDEEETVITPRSDTLIEREIRLTRQREGSLRRVRGYPVVVHQTAVEVPLSGFGRRLQPTASSGKLPASATVPARTSLGQDDDNVAMKRLATNRLRSEILRERQREVDLRNQGKIFTISEERIERPPLLVELVQANSSRRGHTVFSSQMSRRTNSTDSDQSDKRSVSDASPSSDAPRQQLQQQQQQQQPPPRSAAGRQPELPTVARTRLVGERLIEEEVRELRRREQELRDQRRQAAGVTADELKQSSAPVKSKQSYYRRV